MADRNKLPAGLLDDVKNEMDVTWADEATDKKYAGYIAQGMAYLDGKLGEPADYTVDDTPRTLLMEWVRYRRDHALDVFENNYRSMIMSEQHKREVNRFVAGTAQAEG